MDTTGETGFTPAANDEDFFSGLVAAAKPKPSHSSEYPEFERTDVSNMIRPSRYQCP